MNLQTIKSMNGKDEYVLLPINAYQLLKKQIDKITSGEYENFNLTDYVQNPIAVMRIKAHLTQAELADCLEVSQAYISKIEKQEVVSPKLIEKVKSALKRQRHL